MAEGSEELEELNSSIPDAGEHLTDLMWLWGVCMSNPVRTVADRRLNILDMNYKFHCLSNGYLEYDATKLSRTDFWRGKLQFMFTMRCDVRRACMSAFATMSTNVYVLWHPYHGHVRFCTV